MKPTLADCIEALAVHYPQFVKISSADEVLFRGGRVHRLISMGYTSDAYGLLDDLLALAHRLNIVVTVSQWATINPMFTAFGTDTLPSVKWRATAPGAAHAVAAMLVDAATHPESPREPSPEEIALAASEQEISLLRGKLAEAEKRHAQVLAQVAGGEP